MVEQPKLILHEIPVINIRLNKQRGDGRIRYSNGLMYLLGTGERRLLGGLSRAAEEYSRRAKKSARAKKDGAVRDFLRNSSRGASEGMIQVAKIPSDLAKSPMANRGWKSLRRMARMINI